MWTVKILDIPPLPTQMLSLIDYVPNMVNADGSMRHEEGKFFQRKLINSSGVRMAATPSCMTAPTQLQDWVSQNIIAGWKDVRISYFYKSLDSGSTGPHTDQVRDLTLIYNLDPGGEKTKLTFWQEKYKPLLRERGVQAEMLEDLEIVDQIEGPYNCWYLVNSHILHSVENLTRTRINVQVSLLSEHENSILKN